MVTRYFKKIFGAFSSAPVEPAPKYDPYSIPLEKLIPGYNASRSSIYETSRQSPDDVIRNAKAVAGLDIEHCHGSEAVDRWKELRANGDVFPVILGPEAEVDDLCERFEMLGKPDLSRIDSGAFEFPRKYLEMLAAEAADYSDVPDDRFDLDKTVNDIIENWSDAPFDDPQDEPTIVGDLKGHYHEVVYIARIPIQDWTVIPALLRFGEWSEWHTAAFRHWKKKYGAELVAVARDRIEIRVKHRPQLLRDAVTLAVEHSHYCSEDFYDGVGVQVYIDLAKFLMQNDMWYFWWD